MQEAITKVLCCLIDSIYDTNWRTPEEIVTNFLEKSELTLSENYQKRLVNNLKEYLL